MNPGLQKLRDYPFERLRNLREGVGVGSESSIIDLSIGEPKTDLPDVIREALVDSVESISYYPSTRGTANLRQSIANWICKRFRIDDNLISPSENLLPVNGTREALFGICQAMFLKRVNCRHVAIPNPFYQIYEGAAILAGAEPYYMSCPSYLNFIPEFESIERSIWEKTTMVYICSPNNPSGSVLRDTDYQRLLKLADSHDFIVVADECYSEIYRDESNPPLGLLEWCVQHDRKNFEKCLVVNSLSKRSGVPGLRSGFVAGDKKLIKEYYKYRTYQGGAMPLQVQSASAAAWNDEIHVVNNRKYYRNNMQLVEDIFDNPTIKIPEAGFFLWLNLPIDDVSATKTLLLRGDLLVLPGQFLARTINAFNPGKNYIRVALVHNKKICTDALTTIKRLIFKEDL